MNVQTEATAAERQILADLLALFDSAKGDHPALAKVRKHIGNQIDAFVSTLATHGVDTNALMDEIDA